MSGRSTVMVRKGIVSSSHELASFWGANTLMRGGNVVDAALTTSAMLAVVQNNLCGCGGDLFALAKLGGSEVHGLNGSGRAGQLATIDFYKERGLAEIPQRGPLAALTVPGIVHAWGELASRFASMELKDLLAPAIECAESGFPLTPKYVESIRASSKLLGEYSEWVRIFLPGGDCPKPGFVLRQKDLALTLRTIAEEGVESFYKGSLMERIVKGIQEQGGLLTEKDFQDHKTTWDKPLRTNYRGTNVYETAPNSQGATVLLWLNMLEQYDLAKYLESSKELISVLIDTCLKANRERAKHIADPVFHKFPDDFTSKKFADAVLKSSALLSTDPHAAGPDGDTTYFAVADSEGNCVSVIQSNYMGFGSGLVPKGTGLGIQNRGCYFTLQPNHHNSLHPGRRTFHTLCASLGEKENGETRFLLGSMGGDIQPQVHVQLMTKILDFGMDPQSAVDSPRWTIPGTIYEVPSRLLLEEALALRLGGSFSRANLDIEVLKGYSSQMGHAQAIVFEDQGGLSGGADPRGDGAAVGF